MLEFGINLRFSTAGVKPKLGFSPADLPSFMLVTSMQQKRKNFNIRRISNVMWKVDFFHENFHRFFSTTTQNNQRMANEKLHLNKRHHLTNILFNFQLSYGQMAGINFRFNAF